MATTVFVDTHACWKRLTKAGVEPPLAEVVTYECVAVVEGTFERAGCVTRLTDVGFPPAAAEVFADMCEEILEHNRAVHQATAALSGDRADPPAAHVPRGTDRADRSLTFSIWFAGVAFLFCVAVVVLTKFC